jgi:hypothetical protein
MNQISPLGNSICFPLWLRKGRCVAAGYPPAYPLRVQRGIEEDFRISAQNKSPLLTPLSIKGGTAVVPQYLTGFVE